MKAKLPRQEFQDALSATAALTSGRTTKPILGCVRLSAQADGLELGATDGEVGLRVEIPALSVETPGVAVIQVDRLLSIVRELGDVEISLESDDKRCLIRGENSEFKIYLYPAEDFPPVAAFDADPELVITGHEIRRMIGSTIYAAARETSRYAINGVLWQKSAKRLFLVATDGRRLARAGGDLHAGRGADFQVIVPSKALNVFERVFTPPRDADEWNVDVSVTPSQILLRSGGRVLASSLVEGHFPRYEDVIPKESTKRARLGRADFYGAVRKAALLTTEESRAVKLGFSADELVISSQSPEQGEATVRIPVAYDGAPLDIGFNPAFIGDALRALSLDEVRMELDDPARPGIICGEDKNEFLYVVMPVSLAG